MTTLLDGLDADLRSGASTHFTATATGFTALDNVIGGGLGGGDLMVVAGPPGVGKTAMGLQLARHVAGQGQPAIVVCYEHDQTAMLTRLLAQEAGRSDARGRAISRLQLRLQRGAEEGIGLADIMAAEPALEKALAGLAEIGDHLTLLGGSVRDTDLDALDALVAEVADRHDQAPLLVVDYLQKVPSEDQDAVARSRRAVEGLKDLAMHHDMPIVALASLSIGGLSARRLRLSHLDETSAIAFEADLVILLANKREAVAKAHLGYGGQATVDYENWVIWTIEKNRSGPNLLNLEFRKDFTHFRYEPEGRVVSERLADDRLGGDAG